MILRKLLPLVLLMVVASTARGETGPDIQEGLWEISVDLEVAGMPMKMPTNTYTQCIRKDKAVPRSGQSDKTCTQKNVVIKGNTVSWKVSCDNPGGEMTGKGIIIYHKDKMDGHMSMKGQGMNMTTRFKGHRIGDCK